MNSSLKKEITNQVRLLALCIIASAICSNVRAQTHVSDYDKIINEYFTEEAPGAAVLVKKNGKTVYKNAIGIKDANSGQKINADDVFRIASITKQFTAAAILKLEEQGKIDLDHSISKYVKGLNENPSPVKIKHLLAHTSGVKNYTALPQWDAKTSKPNLTSSDIVDIFKNEPLNFHPGDEYRYSNLGYFMLGYIVEVVSGQSFGDYLDTNFFKALDMNHTGYEDQNNPDLYHVQGYSRRDGNIRLAESLDMKLAFAAGGLVSTTEDLAKWNEAVFSNKILSQSHLSLAHSKVQLNDGSDVPYGYGWEIGNLRGLKSIKHDGIINGFISFALYVPERDVFVSVLTNCDCTPHIEEVTSKLAALAVEDPYIISDVPIAKSELLSFQGIYKSESGEEQTIRYQDGELFIFNQGSRKYSLTHIGSGKFALVNSLSYFSFEKDEDNLAQSFIREDFDYTKKWEKISDDVEAIESIKIEEEVFEEYIGKYQVQGAFLFEVYKNEGRMYGSVQGDTKEIQACGEDKFYTVNTDASLEFKRSEDGRISHVMLFLPKGMKADRVE